MLDNSEDQIFGAINVPLTILWTRPFDEELFKDICRNVAQNTTAWADNLSTDERLWLVGKVDTTALYGERVAILENQDNWIKVAVISQPTQQNPLGYPGWVLADQVSLNLNYLNDQQSLPEITISVPQANLTNDSTLTQTVMILSYQTRLPLLAETENYLQVSLPNGEIGYLPPGKTKKTAQLYFSQEGIILEAKRFLDLKYLWGGTSSAGFDCSGLMFRLYQSQGITIPRDASEQAKAGIPISKENLMPGDLLFFAYVDKPNKIHHVGMYIGGGLMIHSPNSRSVIKIETYETGVYGKEFWGARRYY